MDRNVKLNTMKNKFHIEIPEVTTFFKPFWYVVVILLNVVHANIVM